MIFAANSSVLVIFCKRPKPGVGKQRIAADMGSDAALQLSELLLACALEDAAGWDGPVVISPARQDDAPWARKLLPEATIIPQRGANLGERLNHVDREIRQLGGQRVLYIGTDAPGLTVATLASASQALQQTDAVIIPARDGGVTLLGSRRPWPELAALPWETAHLAGALTDCCDFAGLTLTKLPKGYDVDRREDLLDAAADLRADSRHARQSLVGWINSLHAISVVIPVYQDSVALKTLLDRLSRILSTKDQVVVVDAEHSDERAAVCAHFDAGYSSENSHRGTRLNVGAACTRNPVLWFLHADAEPAATAPDSIRRQIAGGQDGGFFRFRFSGRRTWYKSLLEKAINLRTISGIPYGDQGLFASRPAFEAAGGFSDEPLFEEIRLVKKLRDAGSFEEIDLPIGVSPRRWEQDGWLIRTLQNRLLVLGHLVGMPGHALARIYRRPARR
jgi:rSAM/selenodomain-associated transferase 1